MKNTTSKKELICSRNGFPERINGHHTGMRDFLKTLKLFDSFTIKLNEGPAWVSLHNSSCKLRTDCGSKESEFEYFSLVSNAQSGDDVIYWARVDNQYHTYAKDHPEIRKGRNVYCHGIIAELFYIGDFKFKISLAHDYNDIRVIDFKPLLKKHTNPVIRSLSDIKLFDSNRQLNKVRSMFLWPDIGPTAKLHYTEFFYSQKELHALNKQRVDDFMKSQSR